MTASYDALVDVFECIESFRRRLMIYTAILATPPMTEMLIKISAELLSVLALATKQIRQGRFSKSALVERYLRLNASKRNMQRNY